MAVIKQKAYGSIVSLLTTELNSLANNSRSAASSAQGGDGSDADLEADFELVVTYGTGPTDRALIDLYLIRSVDGTNYVDGSDTVRPSSDTFAGSFEVRNVTTAQRISCSGVKLPPGLWKAIIHNNGTGQAFSASGNTLKFRPYNKQVV